MVASARINLLTLVLMASLLSGGCNIVRFTLNTPLTLNDMAFITPGHTSWTEVVWRLGVPDTLTESATGVVATYRFLDLQYSRVNFGWILKFWSPVDPDLIMSRTKVGTDALEVHYDSNGIVTQHGFLRRFADPHFSPYPF